MSEIKIPLEYAKNIHKVLENHVSMGFEIVSQDIKDMVSDEAYHKLTEIFNKYHNANCGPFNRALKRLIEEKEPNEPDRNFTGFKDREGNKICEWDLLNNNGWECVVIRYKDDWYVKMATGVYPLRNQTFPAIMNKENLNVKLMGIADKEMRKKIMEEVYEDEKVKK